MWQSVNGKPQLIILSVSCWPFSEHDSFFMVVCDIRDQEVTQPQWALFWTFIYRSQDLAASPWQFKLSIGQPYSAFPPTHKHCILHLTCDVTPWKPECLKKKKKVYSGQIISLQGDPNIAILKGFFPSLRQRRVSVTSAIVLPPTCTPASRVSTLAASTLRTTCTFMSRPLDTH